MEYQITKKYNVPVDELFKDFSSVERMASWMVKADDISTICECDFSPGGKYHFEMTSSIGDVNHYYGEFTAIKKNQEIDMVWNDGEVQDTLVTFDFIENGDSTFLTLTHANLPDEVTYRHHKEFWDACLDHLDDYESGNEMNAA